MISIQKAVVVFSQGTPLEKVVLNHLSLEIQEGDFVTVLGTNGAGKSTLLNVLAGEIPLSSGILEFSGKKVQPGDSTFSQYVSRVFQDPLSGTCAELSIAENMAIALHRGRRRGLSFALNRQKRTQFVELLRELNLGLESQIDTPMGQLSGGQRQAVSLLMATMSPLKILLLDEHTSALDPRTAEMVLKLSNEMILKRNLTAFMVTHSLSQALRVGNRTIILRDGRVQADFSNLERKKLTPETLMRQLET